MHGVTGMHRTRDLERSAGWTDFDHHKDLSPGNCGTFRKRDVV